jgi:hypothetical protein
MGGTIGRLNDWHWNTGECIVMTNAADCAVMVCAAVFWLN